MEYTFYRGASLATIPSYAERLRGGDTGAEIYRHDGLVVKCAYSANASNAEQAIRRSGILDNIHGYEMIAREGARALLPPTLEWYGDKNGELQLIMTDLGKDLVEREKDYTITVEDYGRLVGYIGDVINSSLRHESSGAQLEGLHMLRLQIISWLQTIASLDEKGTDNVGESIEVLTSLNLSNTATSASTLMLLDFTPNNVFVDDSTCYFIDPWRQSTYRGSFVPSMAQFIANATDIRQYEVAVEAREQLERLIGQVAVKIGLTESQVAAQRLLGEILQYTLSCFVRYGSVDEHEKALEYLSIAKQKIYALVEATTTKKN